MGHKIFAHAPKIATGMKRHKKAHAAKIASIGMKGQAIMAFVQLLDVGRTGIGEVMSSMSTKKAVWSL